MALLGLIPDIKSGVTLRLTREEAQREALGKALGLIGTAMGIIGAGMVFATNPAVKQEATNVFAQLPPEVQANKTKGIIIASAVATLALAWWVRSGTKKETAERYGKDLWP